MGGSTLNGIWKATWDYEIEETESLEMTQKPAYFNRHQKINL
jgi:hypothetical protein